MSAMARPLPVRASVCQQLEQVETALHSRLQRCVPPLREVCQHGCQGGSRVRAALLLSLVADLHGDTARAVAAAVSVELLHAATLLQDDIFDHATTRRGKAATYRQYGQPVATLASDWLLVESYRAATEVSPEALPVMLQTSQSMVQAEAVELTPSTPSCRDEAWQSYESVACGKTAALFAAVMELAAIACGIRDARTERLRTVGQELGFTFQFCDDAADLCGWRELLGKDTNLDLETCKATWATLTCADLLQVDFGPELFERLRDTEVRTSLRIELGSRIADRMQQHRHQVMWLLGRGETLARLDQLQARMQGLLCPPA